MRSVAVHASMLRGGSVHISRRYFCRSRRCVLCPVPCYADVAFSPLPLCRCELKEDNRDISVGVVVGHRSRRLGILSTLFRCGGIRNGLRACGGRCLRHNVTRTISSRCRVFLTGNGSAEGIRRVGGFSRVLHRRRPKICRTYGEGDI